MTVFETFGIIIITMFEAFSSYSFDKEKHKYCYKGKELSGVTKVIGKSLGLHYDEMNARVKIAALAGSAVHEEIETWVKNGCPTEFSASDNAFWAIKELTQRYPNATYFAETIVGDGFQFASAIDCIAVDEDGIHLIDWKNTSKFNREYCSIQLNVYRVFVEEACRYDLPITMEVFATKQRAVYKIYRMDDRKVKEVLYGK